MPIPVDCPACNTRLRAPDGAAGMTLSCPRCQTPVPVPPTPGAARAPGSAAPVTAPRQAAHPPRTSAPERTPRPPPPRRGDPAGNGCLIALAWLFALIALAGIVWILVVPPPG